MNFLNKISDQYVRFAPLFMRVGVAAVLASLAVSVVVGGNGLLSTLQLIGVMLLVVGIVAGFRTRELALVTAFVFLSIFLVVMDRRGWVFDPNLFRDVGLLGVALAFSLVGSGPLSVDRRMAFKKQKSFFVLTFDTNVPAVQSVRTALVRYAPLCIRIGLGIVFILFGAQKLSVPSQTTAEIQQLLFDPNNAESLGSASVINYYIGLLEMIVGLGLLIGLRVRIWALVAAFMAGGIFISFIVTYGVKNDFTLYRDIGLVFGALSLVLLNHGAWSLDGFFAKRRGETILPLAFVDEKELVKTLAESGRGDSGTQVTIGEQGEYKLPPSKLNLPQ